jgi:tRNA G18 (ribose-2'-O)-methylase SpoU
MRSLLCTPAALARLEQRCGHALTAAQAAGATVLVADQRVVNDVVGFDLHRGAIAVADRPPDTPLAEIVTAARRIVVLEGVNDPENLGAIARSARALGADALVLDPTCADPWYRRSVRVSMGEMLHLPIARAPLDVVFDVLAAADIDCWALTPSPAALLAGAEGPGLSDRALAACRNVRIPIRAGVDSLNVGHAVAVALALVSSSTT